MYRRYCLILVVLFVTLLAAGCGGRSTAAPTVEPVDAQLFTPLISATGIVVPAQWARLSMPSGGVIAEVAVVEGQRVVSGQVLVRLKGRESFAAAVAAAEVELLAAEKAMGDLVENAKLERALAEQAKAAADKALDDALKKRANKEYGRASRNVIDEALANYYLAEDEVNKAEDLFGKVSAFSESDPNRASALARLAAAPHERVKKLGAVNGYLARPNAIEVAEADAAVEVARAQVADAERELERLKDGPDPKDLALAEARLQNTKQQLAAAKTALADLELKAPFAGTVSRVYVRANESIQPGQQVLLLADLENLQVETTDLNEIGAAQVDLGDPVIVTFDALPEIVVKGTVARIAPKSAETSGVNYTVIIKLEEIPDKLRWDMTAFVDIQISE